MQVRSRHPLARVSTALHRFAHQHRASVQTLHIGCGASPVVFLVSHPELQHRLLESDGRWICCLPWHIGGTDQQGTTLLDALSPVEVGGSLGVPASDAVRKMEEFVNALLDYAAEAPAEAVHSEPHQTEHFGLGATELQVNQRATVPQRIDNKGTKVEELAGTGRHDAPGG